MARNGIPLKFDSVATQRAEARSLWRATAACAKARMTGEREIAYAQRVFGHDDRAIAITKAAVAPHSTSDSASALSITRVSPLLTIAPQSAAARLFAQCDSFDLTGISTVTVPYPVSFPVGLFVAEGSPIPIPQGVTGNSVLGPTRKLSFICVVSRELDEMVPETASVVIGRLMGQSAGRSLDAAVFDSNAATTIRPAGLLHGLTPIGGTTGAATISDAISGDIALLAQGFSDSNIDFQNMILITNTASYLKYATSRGFQELPVPCLPSMTVPGGTIVGVVPEGVGTGFSGTPEIETSRIATAHFDDTTPLAIGTAGAPPTVAAPTRSFFQSDLLGIKLRLKTAWSVLQPGSVQVITGATW
jgi:hypothetical protein